MYFCNFGFQWPFVALRDCVILRSSVALWLFVPLCGYLLLFVALCGFLWLYGSLALCGPSWLFVFFCDWLPVGLCGSTATHGEMDRFVDR